VSNSVLFGYRASVYSDADVYTCSGHVTFSIELSDNFLLEFMIAMSQHLFGAYSQLTMYNSVSFVGFVHVMCLIAADVNCA